MGDPRRFRNKYEAPKKLWDKDRITADRALRTEYGLKNASEIWRAAAELKKFRREARRLLSVVEEERKKDVEKIMNRLNKFGILPKTASLEDILSLDVKAILERRLQTRILRKGLARTTRQARQLISHGFIAVANNVVTIPSYLVTEEEDSKIRICKPINLEVGPPVEKEEKSEKKEVKKEHSKKEEKPKEENKKAEKKEEKKPEAKVKKEEKPEKKQEKPKEEKK